MSIRSDYPEVTQGLDAAMDLEALLAQVNAMVGQMGPAELQRLRSQVDAALLTRTLELGREYSETIKRLTAQLEEWRQRELAARREARAAANVRIRARRVTYVGHAEQLVIREAPGA